MLLRVMYKLFVLGCLSLTLQTVNAAPGILVLHNQFVSDEKFVKLQQLAQKEGVSFQAINIDHPSDESQVGPADLVILDTPRPNDRAAVSRVADKLFKQSDSPMLTIGGGAPQWTHLPAAQARAFLSYYAAGGEHNFNTFFRYFLAWKNGQDLTHFEAAQRLSEVGFYHPDAPQIFSTLAAYVDWYHKTYPNTVSQAKVAYVVHQSTIGDMSTAPVDALIKKTAAANLLPVVFWFKEADNSPSMASVLGDNQIDVMVNTTHLQQGEARKKDFLALNVPVIQAVRFSDGDLSQWYSAHTGISTRSAAVMLSVPESWGVSDPMVLFAQSNGVDQLIPEQADSLINKLKRLSALRHTPAAEKKVAMMFWNYPAGEKNLSASNLNVPRSIVSIQHALAKAGYQTTPSDEQSIINNAQKMMGALYGSVPLETLLKENLAVKFPLSTYQAWVKTLPVERQQELNALGDLTKHWAVRKIDDQYYFIIPRWEVGHLLMMPQMPRSGRGGEHYHDMKSIPNPIYLAAYLYVQTQFHADALIHLGTHGTQEWLPGKDRGLAAHDYPFLAVGSLPVFYPYIQDNVGEAIQAKRRGRAVTISHQTPSLMPAGLYDQLRDMHHAIHQYMELDEGSARDVSQQQIRDMAIRTHMNQDIGWDEARIDQHFDDFLQELHEHLHELARIATPIGLHTFGESAPDSYLISTVMQQLGSPYYDALGVNEEHLVVESFEDLQRTKPYQVLQRYVVHNEAIADLSPALQTQITLAKQYYANLQDTQENEALLAGLSGHFVAPGAGGDPVRSPDIGSGKNLYAFEAEKIPADVAYRAGKVAYEQLITQFKAKHQGAYPKKLAFSLWSSEAIRHLGVTESEILHALGVRPVWDKSGKVVELAVIPANEMDHPRVDVVVQVTSVYRDQFDHFMRLLSLAIQQIAALDEPDNVIAENNKRTITLLQVKGATPEEAQALAQYRIFSSAPGQYGTGLSDLTLQSTKWDKEKTLAKEFLYHTQFAYGANGWGVTVKGVNAFEEQLRDVQAAVMSRSSNIHGVLSTDHPFEFLGGLSLAVRQLSGQSPDLYITDLRTSTSKTVDLPKFLSDEMRARYLNPAWIKGMQKEGYAGTLEVLKATNNLFGWNVMDTSSVRDDQWQSMFDTYVNDQYHLDVNNWFEQHNPTAQMQLIERMAEAMRKGYWKASDQTKQQLMQRWEQLKAEQNTPASDAVTSQYIQQINQGYGVSAQAKPDVAKASLPAKPVTPTQLAQPEITTPAKPVEETLTMQVKGQVLEQVKPADQVISWQKIFIGLLLLVLIVGSMWWQRIQNKRLQNSINHKER